MIRFIIYVGIACLLSFFVTRWLVNQFDMYGMVAGFGLSMLSGLIASILWAEHEEYIG